MIYSVAREGGRKSRKTTVAKADADYKAAKDACKTQSGNDEEVCTKEAKAAHVRVVADAEARCKSGSPSRTPSYKRIRITLINSRKPPDYIETTTENRGGIVPCAPIL